MSFDVLADDDIANQPSNWLFQAGMARRRAYDQKALTDQRTDFIKNHALENPNHMGQGTAKALSCQRRSVPKIFSTEERKAEEVLTDFPRYSARLLLKFRLLAPLLTRDDDPFYLFDNPVRKDHILGLPYLSAAGIKGLAADAYQRAFPGTVNWSEEKNQQTGVNHFRHDDDHALRLFGIADDGVNPQPSQIGRLHFSPLWFDKVLFLVMNPTKPESAIGTVPIQFEAIAPGQTGTLEVVYCNPYGAEATDETTVRGDLARFLAALAAWWPTLGLGAKRLAGYGAIEIEEATVQAVGWTGLADKTSTVAIPDVVREFLDEQDQLIPETELDSLLAPPGEAGEQFKVLSAQKKQLQERKLELQNNRQQLGNAVKKEIKQVKKDIEKLNKQLEALRKPLQQKQQALRARYRSAQQWLESHPEALQPTATAETISKEIPPVIGERSETGPDSWSTLAEWIASQFA